MQHGNSNNDAGTFTVVAPLPVLPLSIPTSRRRPSLPQRDMPFIESLKSRLSFSQTPVTELDIEALLDSWDDDSSSGASFFSLPKTQPLYPPSPSRVLSSHSIVNLRVYTQSPSPTPSPPLSPATPLDNFPFPPSLSSSPLYSSSSSSKSFTPSYPTYRDDPNDDSTDTIMAFEDLFPAARANPFPTYRQGSVSSGRSSTSSSTPSFASRGTPFMPHQRQQSSSSSSVVLAERIAKFNAALPQPRKPSFAPSAPSAFTAPRAAPRRAVVIEPATHEEWEGPPTSREEGGDAREEEKASRGLKVARKDSDRSESSGRSGERRSKRWF